MPNRNNVLNVTSSIDEATMVLMIQLERIVEHTTLNLESLVRTMRITGASDKVIREVLLNDLENGGRIFGQFKNQFKGLGEYGIGHLAQAGINARLPEDEILKWQAVGKSICPDCAERHGQEGTVEEWKLIGEPQSGFSICGLHCKCTLVSTGKWVKNPLRVPLDE